LPDFRTLRVQAIGLRICRLSLGDIESNLNACIAPGIPAVMPVSNDVTTIVAIIQSVLAQRFV
jgi:hypothetical protein